MRFPHEQYIRFLITLGFSREDSAEHLEESLLLPVDSGYWKKQESLLKKSKLPPQIKKFWEQQSKSKLPKDYLSYMNVIGLKEAWEYNLGKNKEFTIAVDALKDPDISICVRSLLAIKLQSEEISALINGRFGMVFPKKSVELFQRYFFQPLIMSRESWRSYLDKIPNEEKSLIYLAIRGDQATLRAELCLPVKISVADHYQKLHIFAMQKFEFYQKTNSPDADQNALKWAQMAMSSGDKYEKLKIGDATDFGRDIQMEFDFIDTDFPMIGEDNLDEIRQQQVDGKSNDEAAPIPLPLEN
jgi:hypothetical protein